MTLGADQEVKKALKEPVACSLTTSGGNRRLRAVRVLYTLSLLGSIGICLAVFLRSPPTTASRRSARTGRAKRESAVSLPVPPKLREMPLLGERRGLYESRAPLAEVRAFYEAWFKRQGWGFEPKLLKSGGKEGRPPTLAYQHRGMVALVWLEALPDHQGTAVVLNRIGAPSTYQMKE